MTGTPEETNPIAEPTVPRPVGRLARPAIIAIAALSAAVVVAIIVIVVLVIPKQSGGIVAAPTGTPVAASPTGRPSGTPTLTPTPTPTPTQAPVVTAPAPGDPAPADPAPDAGAPALPPPPPPVIPPLSIDSMSASISGPCTTWTAVDLTWSASGALQRSAEMNVRSGGGTPIFNESWQEYSPTDSLSINIDCTRPLWFFTLTVSSDTATKTGRLTFYNGVSQGWSSVAP